MATTENVLTSWKDNYGLWLLLAGGLVGGMMCLMWYMRWLPEIEFPAQPSVASTPATAVPSCYFVARIETSRPALNKTQGAVWIYALNNDTASEDRLPLTVDTFQLDAMGAATVVRQLPPGLYSAIAFLDLNQNGQMDVDEDGNPTEPHATSSTNVAHDWRNLRAASFTLDDKDVQFSPMRFGR